MLSSANRDFYANCKRFIGSFRRSGLGKRGTTDIFEGRGAGPVQELFRMPPAWRDRANAAVELFASAALGEVDSICRGDGDDAAVACQGGARSVFE